MKLRIALKGKCSLRVDVAKPSNILEVFDPKEIVRIDGCGWGVYCEDGIVKEYATWVHSDSDYPQMRYCRVCAEWDEEGKYEIARGYVSDATMRLSCPRCWSEFCSCEDDEPYPLEKFFADRNW